MSLTLTYLTAAVGIGASLMHVSVPAAGLLAGFTALGLWCDLRRTHPVSTWVLNIASIVCVLSALALPGPNGVLGRLLSASVVLLGAKLAARKAERDRLQIMLLSLLLLVGAAVVSVSLSFALLFALYLLLAVLNLVWLPFSRPLRDTTVSRRTLFRLGSVAAGLLCACVPFVLLFYFGLPRATAPLVPGQAQAARLSGLTDIISPGSASEIALSDEVALRVVLPVEQAPLASTPYWRALVFTETDGAAWVSSTTAGPPSPGTGNGQLVSHTVYLEPLSSTALVALDHPVSFSEGTVRAALTADATLVTGRAPLQRTRYQVLSRDATVLPDVLSPEERTRALLVPEQMPAPLTSLVAEVTSPAGDPLARARLLEDHFQHGGYEYSLSPPNPDPASDLRRHPLEQFLQTRTGYCEHFASAMALGLRSLGIPSRLVGGYVGGEYNATGHYYIVRQRSAHVWVEAYIDGMGWTRFDPTPPDQSPAAAAATLPVSGFSAFMDSLRLRWYSLVIGYDLNRQLNLFQSVSTWIAARLAWQPEGERAGRVVIMLGILALGLTVSAALLRRRSHQPLESLYLSLQRRLARAGLRRRPCEGFTDFACRVAASLPNAQTTVDDVTDCYVAWRYGGHTPSREELRRLRRSLRSLPLLRHLRRTA